MNELALFAGGGGGLLGSRLLGWRTVCYVEHDLYCVDVLKARIRDGMLDDAPIWDDVRTFDGHPWSGRVDVVSAGFPCQPFSQAGLQLGEGDPRNMWPDTIRIIRAVRPQWTLLENVPRLLSKSYVRRIFGDLAESGYDAEWDCIPACAVGAPHIRDRLWIVAHASSEPRRLLLQRREEGAEAKWSGQVKSNGDTPSIEGQSATKLYPDADSRGHKNVLPLSPYRESDPGGICQGSVSNEWFATEPELGRVADGVAHRLERIAAIGNGQVPAVVRAAWMLLGGE